MKELLKVENIKKYYIKNKEEIKSVDDISFNLMEGETLGIVGESGSGKSTLSRMIVKIIDSDSGKILFNGIDIKTFKRKEIKEYRKKIQLIFQDPYSSLNPKMKCYDIIADPLRNLTNLKEKEIRERVEEISYKCGIDKEYLKRFPHQFSGGQRQRIGIARALVLNPGIILADEPTSALDTSVQAQIINLFVDLKKELNLTIIFISHDLKIIEHISDRIIVMNQGKIVEIGSKDDIFSNPIHPYTIKLLSSIPEYEFDNNRDFYQKNFRNIKKRMIEIEKGHFVLD